MAASDQPGYDELEDNRASPANISNPELRLEAKRAFIWTSVVGLFALIVYISQSLLVIFGGLVFAAMVDGGARLIGRFLPIRRTLRIALVLLLGTGFLIWLGFFAGSQISQEAAQFPHIIDNQASAFINWLDRQGFAIRPENLQQIAGQLMTGVGTVTRAIGGIFGGMTTLFLIAIIGIYVALEPRLYERGLAWMLPRQRRHRFYDTVSEMAATMRRLMAGRIVGMVFEGIFTWLMLWAYGVPMAALLGILTGMLAFIPNVGAVVSGILMVLVGFSGGVDMGLYTVFVYFLVQTFDGYVVVPLIAKKTVDLAPALVLGAQLIMGILFGILGLFLADPLMAMIKVALERRSAFNGEDSTAAAEADGT
ncbi:AI-2E family transporter [Altererythrobacter sp. B11]|uniref:AI-2E family transporter n=1 Tax=Altererythrobacter sp. B11 TaxID=2060312 RepID=UPI000DC73F32|nr:AI-2E family transporter [Altererythrobacter sp. B11]BBC72262.1 AI-2E family transporter [Altererythrobacter sp. B11]